VGTAFTHRAGYDVTGRGGLKLSEAWAGGMRSLHGLLVHGFPNLMITSNAQSGFTTNFPHAMDERAQHMAYLLHGLKARSAQIIEATEAGQDAWVETLLKASRASESFQAECTPGYYNNEGKPNPLSVQNGSYGRGPVRFFQLLEDWRDAGAFEGVEFR